MKKFLVSMLCIMGCAQEGAEPAHEPSHRPPRGTIFADCWSASRGAPCGFITPKLISEEARQRFTENVCHEEQPSNACTERFWATVSARLEERYSLANADEVARWCRAYPEKCQDPAALEKKWLDSNNAHAAERDRDRRVAHARADEDEDRQRRAAFRKSMADSLRSAQPAEVDVRVKP